MTTPKVVRTRRQELGAKVFSFLYKFILSPIARFFDFEIYIQLNIIQTYAVRTSEEILEEVLKK